MPNKYKTIFFDIGDTLITNKQWLTGALETIQTLSKDYKLGIISNTGNLSRNDLSQLLPANFRWTLFVDKLIILSSEVKIEKPSPAIFKLAVQKAGVAANICLFCSENALDCLVAQQVGLHVFRTQNPPASDIGTLASILKNLNKIIIP